MSNFSIYCFDFSIAIVKLSNKMLGICCAICGHPASTAQSGELFLEDKDWRQSYNGTGALYVDPKKLENKYLMRNPRNWEGLYRLSKYKPSSPSP